MVLKLPGLRIYTAKEIREMHTTLSISLIQGRIENNWDEAPEWMRKIIREVKTKLH